MANSLKPRNPSHNVFEQRLQEGLRWAIKHREQTLTALGTVVIAVLFLTFVIHHHQMENNEAWTQLGNAQGALMQGQTDAAAKALDQWGTRYAHSSAATYEQFLRADLLYRTSDYAQAAKIYNELIQTARPNAPLRPLAISAASAAEEMAGHLPDALKLAREFVDQHPDHFLAAPMMISEARLLEMTQNPSGASAVYDRFVILYPQSPWTALAKARLQTLSTLAPPPTSPPLR